MFKRTLLLVIFSLVFLEILARILPVANGYFLANVDIYDPIAHRVPNKFGISSKGWLLKKSNKRWINNEGFLHDSNYYKSNHPLIAIIGDSQIEAPLLNFQDTVQVKLARKDNFKHRYYTFAMSGAPLTQYLIWLKYVEKKFNPDKVIIVVSPNDFIESFNEYGLFDGFHYLDKKKNNDYKILLRPYIRSFNSKVVENFYFLAYLHNNIGFPELIKSAFSSDREISKVEAKYLINWFLKEIENLKFNPKNIAFVFAPINERVYTSSERCNTKISNFEIDKFKSVLSSKGFIFEDLKSHFCEDFKLYSKEFEFKNDIHWNKEGHRVLSNVIYKILNNLNDNI